MGISRVFICKQGIKEINPIYGIPHVKNPELVIIPPTDLYLDPDYLIDDCTLLDRAVTESPHFDLMKTILLEKDILSTEYANRFISGTLDGRLPGYISKEYELLMHSYFNKRIDEIQKDVYTPVLIYKRRGKYYIKDGKHRAALCAVEGKKVQCIQCEFIGQADGNIRKRCIIMDKKKHLFTKTLDFFNEDN